jgi:hypothetical protein
MQIPKLVSSSAKLHFWRPNIFPQKKIFFHMALRSIFFFYCDQFSFFIVINFLAIEKRSLVQLFHRWTLHFHFPSLWWIATHSPTSWTKSKVFERKYEEFPWLYNFHILSRKNLWIKRHSPEFMFSKRHSSISMKWNALNKSALPQILVF